MRITAGRTSARYVGKFFTGPVKILLDGVEFKHVVEADDEAGYLIHSISENGRFLAKDGELVLERKTGKVEFVGTRLESPAMDAAEAKRARRAARNLRNQNRSEVGSAA